MILSTCLRLIADFPSAQSCSGSNPLHLMESYSRFKDPKDLPPAHWLK